MFERFYDAHAQDNIVLSERVADNSKVLLAIDPDFYFSELQPWSYLLRKGRQQISKL